MGVITVGILYDIIRRERISEMNIKDCYTALDSLWTKIKSTFVLGEAELMEMSVCVNNSIYYICVVFKQCAEVLSINIRYTKNGNDLSYEVGVEDNANCQSNCYCVNQNIFTLDKQAVLKRLNYSVLNVVNMLEGQLQYLSMCIYSPGKGRVNVLYCVKHDLLYNKRYVLSIKDPDSGAVSNKTVESLVMIPERSKYIRRIL